MRNDVRDVLVQARTVLERGWLQGAYTDDAERFCIRAAISIAASALDVTAASWTAASEDFQTRIALELDACRVVEGSLPEPWLTIPGWNDDADTIHNDVLSVMDKAISAC